MANNDFVVEVLVASLNDCRAFTNELKDERKALKAELEKAAAGLASRLTSLLVERDSLRKELETVRSERDKARSELKHVQDSTRHFREQMEDKLIHADINLRNAMNSHEGEIRNLKRDLRNMTLARDEILVNYSALIVANKQSLELEAALLKAKK